MKILDKYFGGVFVITADAKSELRANRTISQLEQVSDKVRIFDAVVGDQLPPAGWWRAGNGAWGCLMSHVAIAQMAWKEGLTSYIVFEDDAILIDGFAEKLEEFMSSMPENWDQIYLGGQHRASPRNVNECVLEPRRVNRTHCFALKRDTIPEFLNHVTDFQDHIQSSFPKHIDHRLEDAHRSRRWNTYCPSWWLVGQGENQSQINGRYHPNKWWDHDNGFVKQMTYIYCDRKPTEEEMKYLHFGWAEREKDSLLDPYFLSNPQNPRDGMHTIADEAFACRKLPAAAWGEMEESESRRFREDWPNHIKLSEADLPNLANYPANGLFHHRWLNPEK